MAGPSPSSSTSTLGGDLVRVGPSLCLLVLMLAPPFTGTLQAYRAAMFILVGFAVVCWFRSRPRLDPASRLILGFGAAFTIWSVVSALFGIDSKYSTSRWRSEHLYGFMLFAAILLYPGRYVLRLVLWGGTISVCMIALGVALDLLWMGPWAGVMLNNLRLWKVAYLKGFSSDITWITSHLILVFWTGPVALLIGRRRDPLFWSGILATLAGLWVAVQTFQVMVFVVIYASAFVFMAVWLWRKFPRQFGWIMLGTVLLLVGVFAYRDLALYPDKKIVDGVAELVTTGKTENTHLQSRISGVRWAIHKIGERPLLGWGPGREILRRVDPDTFDITESDIGDIGAHPPIGHLHNQYADLLIRVGIPGLLFYVLFLAAIVGYGLRRKLWRQDWRANPGACFQLGALIATAFALLRLLTETFPASSVSAQYWMLLALACLPSEKWVSLSETVADRVNDPLLIRRPQGRP